MVRKRRQESDPEEEADSDNETGSDAELQEEYVGEDDDKNDEALSSEEEDEGTNNAPEATPLPAVKSSITSDGRYHNKQRLLLLSSRGITARYRHLLEDLRTLTPHSKKESKLDVGKRIYYTEYCSNFSSCYSYPY